MILPLASNRAPSTTTRIVIRRARASAIWLATVRFQIKS